MNPITDRHQILTGDCLELMRAMPDKCVDLVMCSPPYEAARTYGIGFDLKGQAWVDWCFPRFMECLRVCRGLVCWVVEGQTRDFRYSAAPILLMADLHRAGVNLRKPPIYARVGIPGSGGPDWFRNDYEFAICATPPGKLPWSDNTACGHPPKWAPGGAMSHRLADGTRRNEWGSTGHATGMQGKRANGEFKKRAHTKSRADGTDEIQSYAPPVKANPGNVQMAEDSEVVWAKVGGGLLGSKLAHKNEAPHPEALVERFVLSFCPPDGTVLDPFSGSGTTMAVALKHGRRAISIDVRQSQSDIQHRRAAEVIGSGPTLFTVAEGATP